MIILLISKGAPQLPEALSQQLRKLYFLNKLRQNTERPLYVHASMRGSLLFFLFWISVHACAVPICGSASTPVKKIFRREKFPTQEYGEIDMGLPTNPPP